MRSRSCALAAGLVAVALVVGPRAAATGGTWMWPVIAPVLRIFDPPATQYGAGHRGIDIACARGAPVVAAATGVVTFAGSVGGQRYVTVDHGDGLATTYSYVDAVRVRKGQTVTRGQPVAACGTGHPGSLIPHVHLGVKRADGTYVDPLAVLAPAHVSSFVHLAERR